ncbi:probable xyloglucan galactosyltransferase GT14 [Gossypium raimondii]|uniref:Exostosin GT47 domain-containing protein n=2 Tax=Gossypium raimondii TaxID=29730 RepID=A0A0D2VMN8_GOSRA|nr:probable xyloglucan galactosyltransferase GT14 [Gossypium raimondii]KJB71990.1 hypothetical protein B456_011G152600 [Gossypium raimondii]
MKFHALISEFCVAKPLKNKWRNQSRRINCSKYLCFLLMFSIVLLIFLRHLFFFSIDARPSSHHHSKKKIHSLVGESSSQDSCLGRYIYIHDLPMRFNQDLLTNCQVLTRSIDKTSMCEYVQNSGFGPRIISSEASGLWNSNWFWTNQFMLEVIFHDRMKKYKCLTNDSLVASAIFVPYYAGLDLRRYLWGFNTSMRDSSGFDLINWLKQKPQWKTMWGKDHFLVSSRIARDFRRKSDRKSDWGSNFRFLPESKNLSMLTIESGPWENDIAVPYPTSFHPSSDDQVLQWQNLMRTQNRPYLFSFAGASRNRQKNSTRKEIIRHCQSSNKLCKLLDCNSVGHECDDPLKLMNLFRSSIFCLQPPGDSLTRRSTFDSILAGCIPVFFHPGSAYTQYLWYLPKNYSNYSVFISATDLKLGKVRIEEKLVTVSKDEVASMREEVIRLIPRIIYGDRRSGVESVEDDAFDLAIKGVLKRVDRLRGSDL